MCLGLGLQLRVSLRLLLFEPLAGLLLRLLLRCLGLGKLRFEFGALGFVLGLLPQLLGSVVLARSVECLGAGLLGLQGLLGLLLLLLVPRLVQGLELLRALALQHLQRLLVGLGLGLQLLLGLRLLLLEPLEGLLGGLLGLGELRVEPLAYMVVLCQQARFILPLLLHQPGSERGGGSA